MAQQLAAGVTAGTGDRDPFPRHLHDYTRERMFICKRVHPVQTGAQPR
jgi:hypothetical protein